MYADERLKIGDIDGALHAIQEQVRKEPAQAKYRIFLFQLLVVIGQWPRALNQLQVIAELDASALAMVQTYREVLHCEQLRTEIFAGKRSPLIFGQPEEWIALLIESLNLLAQGTDSSKIQKLYARALEAAPTTSGRIDGAIFNWIMDGDNRLGPALEAIVNDRYYWIPFHRIRSIDLEKPEDLRDLVWMPAHFIWANGGETVGLIPTRYPGAESHSDTSICLARKTDWQEPVAGFYIGQGQRMLITDSAEYPLMDVRRIEFDTVADQISDATALH